MKRFDPTSAYDCMLMRRRIDTGWEPTPGTDYSVIVYRLDVDRVVCFPSVRTTSAQRALERTLRHYELPRKGIIMTVVTNVVTTEDVITWREDRDRWLTEQGG